jgi:hypothetical protein
MMHPMSAPYRAGFSIPRLTACLFLWLGSLLCPFLALAADAPDTLPAKQLSFLEAAARGRSSGRWNEAGSNELTTLRLKAEAYQRQIASNHLVRGLIVSKRYSDTNQSSLVSYEELELSAALTGFHLAALSYWFSVDLKPSALDLIRENLTGLENLTMVSGRPGYIAAFAGPTSDPAFKTAYSTLGGADPARPGFGKLAFPGSNGQVWIGGASQDTYSAVVLGLSSVYKRIRDPKVRLRASNLVEIIFRRLDEDQWRIRDGQGHETFVAPHLQLAILRTAASINPDSYNKRYENAFAPAMAYPPQAAPKYGNAGHSMFALANLVTLSRLETNETRSLAIQGRITDIWRKSGSEMNPWIAAAYVNAFDHAPNDTLATATLQGILQLYPSPPRWQRSATLLRTNHPTITANQATWSKDALLLHERVASPFAWTDSPRALPLRPQAPTVHSGVDYLLCFWMARDAGVIPHESAPRIIRTFTNPRTAPTRATNIALPIPPTSTNRLRSRVISP